MRTKTPDPSTVRSTVIRLRVTEAEVDLFKRKAREAASVCPQSPSASNAEGLITQNIRQKQDQNTKMGYIQYKTTKADDPF